MAAGVVINGKGYRIEEYVIFLFLVSAIYALIYIATR